MNLENENFTTTEALGVYLRQFGIPIEQWGKGDAKEISHLYSELLNGDSKLVNHAERLVRKIRTANISVYAYFDEQRHVLTEDRQVFNEGTPRERVRYRRGFGGAVKEKIYGWENPDAAIPRALYDELGIDGPFHINKNGSKEVNLESPSYPGLQAENSIHYYNAILVGDQIRKEGYKEVQPDKTTYFVWTAE